ncbi:MAG: penicillin acylase family protein [Solirubrobacterales bacterium]
MRRVWTLVALGCVLAVPAAANAAPSPEPYGANDAGGFHNILPAGQGQSVNGAEIASFLATGARPPHDQDQLAMYRDLAYATPGLTAAQLPDYYKDATFGVKPADVERTYSPRDDVTIVRDKFGVPHIYGATRAGAMFGAGYVAAEDRMFFIDALRHAGRAELAAFAGGSPGNREMDASVWADTPYNESDLQLQYDLGDDVYGAEGKQLQEDAQNFVDGINHRIAEIRANPLLMPGEYPLLGHPNGPEDWTVNDVISVASLVAGIFGKGGGNEVGSALALENAQKRFGKRAGQAVWADFRSQNDPEAPTTVRGKAFPYEKTPAHPKGTALPDRGSTEASDVVVSRAGGAKTAAAAPSAQLPDIGDMLGNLRSMQGSSSNALLVSGKESDSGTPLAVFGPQVSYFTPQILMEEDIHAPGGPTGPPIDARGTAFPGTNLYVQLGHGRNYAWSATSAGQDIIDTFAVKLCNADGSKPTLQSTSYIYNGQCVPMEVLDRVDSWTQSAGDMTPSGTQTLRAYRTQLGIVYARATIHGKPVAYTKLRDTYFHEVDSALGFSDFNNPEKMATPQGFMSAAAKIDYTFNWFYVNDKHIAYFNSGANPVRSKLVDPNLPVLAKKKYEWRGYDTRLHFERRTPASQHPQAIDQPYLTSWNNKQARKYSAADNQWGYSSLYRSLRLDRRIQAAIRGKRKASLPELVSAMEDGGSVDLRGAFVLPWALEVIGKAGDANVRKAVKVLRAWQKSGAHRLDKDRDGHYDQAEAVRIMDAWWPLWVKAEFKPTLGGKLYDSIVSMLKLHDAPGELGSAFQDGWYGYASKDLRTILGEPVKGRYSRIYCGRGSLARCRQALVNSLSKALAHDSDAEIYPGEPDSKCKLGDAQVCTDAIRYRATGAITQPPQPWIDRPTFQQAVEIGH